MNLTDWMPTSRPDNVLSLRVCEHCQGDGGFHGDVGCGCGFHDDGHYESCKACDGSGMKPLINESPDA